MTSKIMEDMIEEYLNDKNNGYYKEVAERMLNDGRSIEEVQKYTNLSFDAITEIINEINIKDNQN